jgi:hypothetical protein
MALLGLTQGIDKPVRLWMECRTLGFRPWHLDREVPISTPSTRGDGARPPAALGSGCLTLTCGFLNAGHAIGIPLVQVRTSVAWERPAPWPL